MQYRHKIGYISFFIEENDSPHCKCGVMYDGTLYADEFGNVHQGDDWARNEFTRCKSKWHEMSDEEKQRISDINNVYGTSGFRY